MAIVELEFSRYDLIADTNSISVQSKAWKVSTLEVLYETVPHIELWIQMQNILGLKGFKDP